MKKHDSYKNSGVKWLEEIPTNWQVKKLGTILKSVSVKNNPDKPLLSITREKGVILRDLEDDTENHNFIPDDLSGYKLIRKGQFGMNKMKAWQGSYGVSDFDGIVSPAYYIFQLDPLINPLYFHKAIRSRFYVAHFGSASDGVRIGQWDLSKTRMKAIPFFIPPFHEQQAIADFLDDKTTKIDQAIAIKEKEINLLKERRQILIQELVTGKKVWDGTQWTKPTKTKDSGVDWIGEIPEDWEVTKLKFLGSAIIGLTYAPEDLCSEEEGTLVLRSSNLNEGKFVYGEKENAYVNKQIPTKLVLQQGDILICSRNGSRDLIGKCAYATEKDAGNSFGAFTTVFRSKINDYLFCILNSNIFKSLSGSFLTSTINQLTIGNLNSIQVPIPTAFERVQIKEKISELEGRIQKGITLKQKEIEKLKEYKTVLIDNVVTGKIKVS